MHIHVHISIHFHSFSCISQYNPFPRLPFLTRTSSHPVCSHSPLVHSDLFIFQSMYSWMYVTTRLHFDLCSPLWRQSTQIVICEVRLNLLVFICAWFLMLCFLSFLFTNEAYLLVWRVCMCMCMCMRMCMRMCMYVYMSVDVDVYMYMYVMWMRMLMRCVCYVM